MELLKRTIFSPWGFLRIVRLVLGTAFFIQAFLMKDVLTGLLSALILFQVFTNTGCCSGGSCDSGNCEIPDRK